MDLMPEPLKRALRRLWQSSADAAPKRQAKPEIHLIENGRPISGSELYHQIVEDEKKKRLAEEAVAARKLRDMPNYG